LILKERLVGWGEFCGFGFGVPQLGNGHGEPLGQFFVSSFGGGWVPQRWVAQVEDWGLVQGRLGDGGLLCLSGGENCQMTGDRRGKGQKNVKKRYTSVEGAAERIKKNKFRRGGRERVLYDSC